MVKSIEELLDRWSLATLVRSTDTMYPFQESRVILSENKSKLEAIVWPEIMNFVLEEAGILFDQGQEVIVLDAAVLLAANWHSSLCHEVPEHA